MCIEERKVVGVHYMLHIYVCSAVTNSSPSVQRYRCVQGRHGRENEREAGIYGAEKSLSGVSPNLPSVKEGAAKSVSVREAGMYVCRETVVGKRGVWWWQRCSR